MDFDHNFDFDLDFAQNLLVFNLLEFFYMDFDHNFDFDLDFAQNLLVFNPILDPCPGVRLASGDYLDLQPGPSPNLDFEIDFDSIQDLGFLIIILILTQILLRVCQFLIPFWTLVLMLDLFLMIIQICSQA